MVEDLRRLTYLHVLGSDIALVNKKWHLAKPLAGLVGINRSAKHYQNMPNDSRVKAFSLTVQKQVHKLSTDRQVDYRALFESRPYSLSTFLLVMQYNILK